ncbi:MAG: hypothetical protein AB1610_00395 [Nitrospirota bacterium]
MLETVENPEFIIKGNKGTLKATKNMGKATWMVVVYKEISKTDGFVITAYFLDKRPSCAEKGIVSLFCYINADNQMFIGTAYLFFDLLKLPKSDTI